MLSSPLTRRLLPIYIAKFFRNFVFWYSIEKLFMTSIGFNDASIGVMVAIYSFMTIALEIPSGILADRWSRKGVLVLASVALTISSLLGWLSHDITVFLFCTIFWGFFDALASGTDTSQLYDTLLEEKGTAKNFQKYLGRYEAVGGVSLILGALSGGFIGQALSLRDTFSFTIIPCLISIIATLMIRETKIHKQEHTEEHFAAHTIGTFKAVFGNPNLTWIVICFLAISVVQSLLGEMYQLWYLALAITPALYGVAGSIVLSTYGIGGAVTEFFTTKRRVMVSLIIVLAATIVACISRNFWVILTSQFLIGFLAFTLSLILTTQINHELPSRYRAGAGSIINSAMRVALIPLALLFGWMSYSYSIFVAATLLVILTCVAIYAELRTKVKSIDPPQIIDTPY